MGKPIKPSKNLVYCFACKKRKMLFEEKSGADNFIKYNQGGILEENGKAPVRSYYCELCCGYHVTSNPSTEYGEKMDNKDNLLIHEIASITKAMDSFKLLGRDLAIRIQNCKELMYMGNFQEIQALHNELLSYRVFLVKLPLESKTKFATLFRSTDFLYDIASTMDDMLTVPDEELERFVKHKYPAISEESLVSIRIMARLKRLDQSIQEMSSLPDGKEREDFQLKVEEMNRYLTEVKKVVGRKVTAFYRRKLGLCN